MKLFSSKKKATILGALVGVMTLGSVAFAATTPVKLDAFYDTFKLNVNGTQQFINDRQFKPFIADSRIYIPLSTLNQLGVVNAVWDASTSSVNITPSGSASGEVALYQQHLAALNVQLEDRNKEITDLKSENTKLKTEATALKAEIEKLKNNSSNNSNTSTSALRNLEDTFNRSRSFSRYSFISQGANVFVDFEFIVDAYREDIEISMYTGRNTLTDRHLIDLAADSRYFNIFMEDIAIEATKSFKDSNVYITIYNGQQRSNASKIGDYTYDGRRLAGKIY